MPSITLDRRRFLKLSAAAAALAAGGCRRPAEPIVPYAQMPETTLPGLSQFFATVLPLGGDAEGLLVEASTGRPIKVEGNPQHPASRGGTSVHGQASVLQLWDPDRSQTPRRQGELATRDRFALELEQALTRLDTRQGEGLAVLVDTLTSPTLQRQLDQLVARYPHARIHCWEPLHRDRSRAGARFAFGRPLAPVYDLAQAGVILSLDCDVLSESPGRLAYARQCAQRRRSSEGQRLYAIESAPSITGARADHRYALPVTAIENWLIDLAAPGPTHRLQTAIWKDLEQARGVIVCGEALAPDAHALVHRLNHQLGAPVRYIDPPDGAMERTASIMELAQAMRAGAVQMLVMLGGNPVYDAPADALFADALAHVAMSVHLSLYEDETSAHATWHLPATHFMEHWSDARAFDGSAAIVQPVIAPLYGGTSPHELLAALLRAPASSSYDLVREYWSKAAHGDFEQFWRESLTRGAIAGSAFPSQAVAPQSVTLQPRTATGWTLRFAADESVRDGAFANNAWLQELPRSLSKLTWDNAALVAPKSAQVLGVRTGDVLELAVEQASLRVPVWVLPGHAENTLTLPLGYGRTRAGRVGNRVGFDAYPLRTAAAAWTRDGISLRRIGGAYMLATTQHHARMEGRDLAREVTRAAAEPGAIETPAHSLYPDFPYESYRWGMTIDLDACIGCNVCTIACQAENNIPTVGKEQVRAGREMHWIRVDRYYDNENADAALRTVFQPVPCMHCEKAPCEEVCPVGATVHDSEGLNLQVYNRCVGTRFCSQNCPYKVRRFNFLQYTDTTTESLKAQRNPEVTVRMRGVMEKCTYCIQRITRARIEADKANRRIHDGEVVTACQAACPTQAIVFGDLGDQDSALVAVRRLPRHYTLLAELNTRPRTTYLARVRNANADIADG